MGSVVLDRLATVPDVDVVAVVRDPERCRRQDVEVRVADYADQQAMTTALHGVQVLVFISSDGPAATMLQHHLTVLAAAARARVRHVIYLSIVDVQPQSPFCYAEVNRLTELSLRDAKLPHTVVRAGMYAEFFGRWLIDAPTAGALSLPMGDGRLSLIFRADVGACLAAVAAADPPVARAPYVLTGSRLYDLDDLAEVATGLGRGSVRPVPTTIQDFGVRLLREQTGPWWTYAITSMFASISEHRFEPTTDDATGLIGVLRPLERVLADMSRR